MKHKKRALFQSVLALILCLSMLVGTTFAWFTDSVTSGSNIIQAGNLDIGMEFTGDLKPADGSDPVWTDASSGAIFSYENWEPGYTDLKYLRITNEGNLAFQYQLTFDLPDTTTGNVMDGGEPGSSGVAGGIVGDGGDISNVGNSGNITAEGGTPSTPAADALKLAEAIDVYYLNATNEPFATREEAMEKLVRVGTLSDLLHGRLAAATGVLLPEESLFSKNAELPATLNPDTGSTTACIMLKMREDAGNEYMDCSAGGGFCVKVLATQYAYEEDAFGSDYDTKAAEDIFPAFTGTMGGTGSVTTNNGVTTEEVTIGGAKIPAGVQVTEGTKELTVSITEKSGSDANVQLRENEAMRSLDVHIEGVSADNTVPIIVDLGQVLAEGFNQGNVTLYHVENGADSKMTQVKSLSELDAHNEFYYDPATGNTTVAMATFSEVALVANTVNAWNGTVAEGFSGGSGNETDPYIIANADQLAYMNKQVSSNNDTSAYYKLIADVNIGGSENYNDNKVIWYPIGYWAKGEGNNKAGEETWYTKGGKFSGVFDGAGHTITGIYQNTWAMDGNYDNGYWNEAMGLFGYVYNGTVKNLTIDNFYSEGEFAPTGCVAAMAEGKCTFENIAITNSHPQTYNTGVAGIVGWDEGGNSEFTFRNITVDSSNTISALWGSWDVAAAGLLGYLGSESEVLLENCHVSATIDVYNDVCGNYQYYWYRYCGMLIGTVDKRLDNGKGALDLSNVTAKGCTVNFGDRHEYYYCEFEKNSQASYTDDFQFSRVDHSELNMDANPVTCKHTHTANEDKQAVYIPFQQLFGGYGWGVDGVDLGEYDNIEVSVIDSSQEKTENNFVARDYVYRVGNVNAIALSSLFSVKKDNNGKDFDINDSGVYVTIDKVDENSNVSGTFTANTTDWTKGTIQFSGTGKVKVSIQDYAYSKPVTLILEVIDAVNATSATSATKNNVVLLNDCGFSSIEVSGGYTLYGNGFTMTCASDSAALDMGYSFVTLNNGTLDNVQIVCPNFDYAVLYKSNMTESGNRSETTDKTRYYNVKSGVMASGNSQILNSRISGGRAAVNVSGGNLVIDNSRIELGAVASVLVGAANSLTMRDVTLVQKPTASTYDSNKKLMGFSVLYLCDSEGKATPTTLEGNFVQNAWVNADDKQYVPSAGQDIVDGVMKETAFIHNINGKDSLNLGFAYMPEDAQKTVAAPDNITDNRTDKDTVPYEMKDVKVQISILSTTVYVYSYKNTSGTADSFKTESEYVPNQYGDIIVVNYADTVEGLTTGKTFGTDGWVYELNVDLDKLSGYALDFSKLSMSVNGVAVTDFKVNGNAKPISPVAVTAGGTTYTLTATVDGKEYTATFKVTGTETSKASPSLVGTPSYGAGFGVANKYGGDWSGAAPVLDGITIKYWSVADSEYKEFALSSITFANTGKQNGTNNYWEYTHTNNDFTLKLTNTAVMHSSSGTYGMPVAGKDGKLYFTIASSGGFVSTGTTSRSITISYEFTDNNGGETLKFSHTWSIPYSKDEQYNYSSFTSDGTLTKLESGSSSGGDTCLAEGTLITMADGTKRAVEDLRKGDKVMAFDHLTGKITSNDVIIVVRTSSDFYKNTFVFDDGTELATINEHGIYDLNVNKYVNISHENADEFIGHSFVAVDPNGKIGTKKLVDVVSEFTSGYKYDIVTDQTLNYVAEDTLSVTHVLVDIIDTFEFDSNMLYDQAKMQADIEKYGLYTYDEWEAYCDISVFEQYNIPVMKVGVSKGMYTKDYIISLINTYVLDDSVQIID